jgi:hypothetical protein
MVIPQVRNSERQVRHPECNEGSPFAENHATFRRSFAQKDALRMTYLATRDDVPGTRDDVDLKLQIMINVNLKFSNRPIKLVRKS